MMANERQLLSCVTAAAAALAPFFRKWLAVAAAANSGAELID